MTTTAYPINFIHYEGIYEIPESARYIYAADKLKYAYASQEKGQGFKITSQKLIRWIHMGLALPALKDVHGRGMLITFEDLVSVRIIAALRAAGVSFPKIYEAEDWLRVHTAHPRPFAVEAIWTERTEVFAEFKNRLVTASRAGQIALDLLREYIIPVHGLTFEEEVAATWEPLAGILLDPEIQFGAPCIKGTRIPAKTIRGMIQAGDPRERVKASFGLSDQEMDAAIKWEDTTTTFR
ncbi:MAG: DUF433 domain-containing protein [Dehalococcoidia bacterium]|nr:DUF433 domain-containing protein [Dehalococcoidia bacterium]